jgi:hypothetical protein
MISASINLVIQNAHYCNHAQIPAAFAAWTPLVSDNDTTFFGAIDKLAACSKIAGCGFDLRKVFAAYFMCKTPLNQID